MGSVRTDGLLGHWDRTEVLNDEDVAAHRADEFLALAKLDHETRKRGGAVILRGTCCFCQAQCSPQAVYCDADCRDDHERELAALARQGRSTA